MSDMIGRGEPPGLLGLEDTVFLIIIPVHGLQKKPVKIGMEGCCLKIGSKKGLKKFWCSCHIS